MSAWDDIVGIDLDVWMQADNDAVQIAWLAWLRDHPMPEQGLPIPTPLDGPDCTCEKVLVPSFDTMFVASIPGRREPDCPEHGRVRSNL